MYRNCWRNNIGYAEVNFEVKLFIRFPEVAGKGLKSERKSRVPAVWEMAGMDDGWICVGGNIIISFSSSSVVWLY